IAGSHDEVNLFLETVRLLSVEADLIPPLVKPSVALDHCEVTVGSFVVERDGVSLITGCIAGCGPAEGTAHARTPVGFRDVRVAVAAYGGIDVVIFSKVLFWRLRGGRSG